MALSLTAAQQRSLQQFRRIAGHLTVGYTVREWLDVQVRNAWRDWQTALPGQTRKAYAAYEAAVAAREAYEPADESYMTDDERAGFKAFPAGAWMDARRGKKSFPQHARCPFRDLFRIRAWERGYAMAQDAIAA